MKRGVDFEQEQLAADGGSKQAKREKEKKDEQSDLLEDAPAHGADQRTDAEVALEHTRAGKRATSTAPAVVTEQLVREPAAAKAKARAAGQKRGPGEG